MKYGKKAVAYAWDHKSAILKLIEKHATISTLVKYVLAHL